LLVQIRTEALREIPLCLFRLEEKSFILVGAQLHRQRRRLSVEFTGIHGAELVIGHAVDTVLMIRHFCTEVKSKVNKKRRGYRRSVNGKTERFR